MSTANVVLLASYPKSGNTWMRVLLHGLLSDGTHRLQPDINALDLTSHAGSRSLIESVCSCPSSELTAEELGRLRAAGLRSLSVKSPGLCFVKVHDGYDRSSSKQSLFPIDVSRRVIYLVRNPLDIAVSFAAHLGIGIDETISRMESDFCLSGDTSEVAAQVPQHLGSWSEHVAGWTTQGEIPVDVVRYEDLSSETEMCLLHVAAAVGLPVPDDAVTRAVKAAAFERLQSMEMHAGFREKPNSHSGLFFRSGRPGGWRQALTARQVDRLVRGQHEMMRLFGYLESL